MNLKKLFLPLILGIVLLFSGCGNHELKEDAAKIGDAMCRNIEIMNKMKAANPSDSATLIKLREQAHQLQIEMTIVYKEFGDKYGDKTKDPKFNKKFNRELRKAMLDCPSLSKQDREMFEKDLKE
jgi:ABC-type tungstate transport system permease subunit